MMGESPKLMIRCNHCGSMFKLDRNQIRNSSVKVRCSKCKHVFSVYADDIRMSIPPNLGPLLENFKREFNQVLESIKSLLAEKSEIISQKTEPVENWVSVPSDGLQYQLIQLANLLDMNDFQAADYFAHLKDQIHDPKCRETMAQLEHEINVLNFNTAMVHLKILAQTLEIPILRSGND